MNKFKSVRFLGAAFLTLIAFVFLSSPGLCAQQAQQGQYASEADEGKTRLNLPPITDPSNTYDHPFYSRAGKEIRFMFPNIAAGPAGQIIMECSGVDSSVNNGWVVKEKGAGAPANCVYDVCSWELNPLNENCVEVDRGEFTVDAEETMSCNNGIDQGTTKQYCVFNEAGTGAATVLGDSSNDDMFRIEAGAEVFFEYFLPGDDSIKRRFIINTGTVDIMMPSGPAGTFQDYRDFVNVTGNKRHPDVDIEYACSPTLFKSCDSPPPQDGTCHAGSPILITAAPTAGDRDELYCSVGSFQNVSGSGTPGDPWTWECTGVNGGNPTAASACQGVNQIPGDCSRVSGRFTYPDEATFIADTISLGFCDSPEPATPYTGAGTPGPWTWTCPGTNGGADANCSAGPPPPVNGSCAWNFDCTEIITTEVQLRASGKQFCDPPTLNASVTVSLNSSPGEIDRWEWTCPGQNGGSDTTCRNGPYAAEEVPQCSSANGSARAWTGAIIAGLPDDEFCASGDRWDPVLGGNPIFGWSCRGSGAFCNEVNCQTTNCFVDPTAPGCPPTAGVCGPNDGQSFADYNDLTVANYNRLCDATSRLTVIPADVTGPASGPWNWTCFGMNGGADVPCEAYGPSMNGACGSANGQEYASRASIPAGNLCAAGTATPISADPAPWTWTCQGSGGGSDANCSADEPAVSPPPPCRDGGFYLSRASVAASACEGGATLVGSVTGDGYPTWSFTCDSGTEQRTCYATRSINGYAPRCGSASGRNFPPGVVPPAWERCTDGGNRNLLNPNGGQVVNFGNSGLAWEWECHDHPSATSPGGPYAGNPPAVPPASINDVACTAAGSP